MESFQFIECETCKAKPGSPELCASCLNNRSVIDKLKNQRNATTEASIVIRKDDQPVMMIIKDKGEVQYFKLKKASYQDHMELHNVKL